jgi:glycerophosphoryl diester phosphodiesterase
MFSNTSGLVIERDSAQNNDARHKKIYRINFDEINDDGFLNKTLVADLLDIQDPFDLNLDGNRTFRFPHWTIEGLEVINRNTLGLVNDNNYPFGQARDSTGAHADGTEFILIEVAPLWD